MKADRQAEPRGLVGRYFSLLLSGASHRGLRKQLGFRKVSQYQEFLKDFFLAYGRVRALPPCAEGCDLTAVYNNWERARTELEIQYTPNEISLVSVKWPQGDYAFCKQGDSWLIVFEGRQIGPLQHLDGFEYIAYLLTNEGQEFTPLVFRSAVKPSESAKSDLKGDDIMDNKTMSPEQSAGGGLPILSEANAPSGKNTTIDAYKAKLKKLGQERAKAEAQRDHFVLQEIDKETEQIEKELRSGVNLHGRQRTTRDPIENARINITMRIEKAFKKISSFDKEAGEHFRGCIGTGGVFSYKPGTTMGWIVSITPEKV
jgi:hypothetical protein